MKKILLLLITIAMFVACLPLTVGADATLVTPRYALVLEERSDFIIDSNGTAYIIASYESEPNQTRGATVTIRLQKKILLLFWQDIDLDDNGGEWDITTTSSSFKKTLVKNLSTGTYRVQIEYKIRSTDGTVETINREYEQKY